MIWQRVCIIGVGLLGGSVGMALKQRQLAKEVVGVGRSRLKLNTAIQHGAIDAGYESLLQGAQDADLIIACTPVQNIVDSLAAALPVAAPNAILTDVGSTKLKIAQEAEQKLPRSQFLGSHPIAGGHNSGVEFASKDLLQGAIVVVTPTPQTPPELEGRVTQLWESLGATVRTTSPAQHDEFLAFSSHLPHIVASALSASTPTEVLPYTGKGWGDSTRIAAGNATLWRQILEENHAPALQALKNFATICQTWIEALEGGDFDQVESLLEAGKTTRDAVASRHLSG